MKAISTVGFPIVVAMYSLIRLEKTVKDNTIMVTKLVETLTLTNKEIHTDTK